MSMEVAVKEYDTKIDAKKRIRLRGSTYDYYHVVEFPDGKVELEPRTSMTEFTVSADTLHMIDASMENLKKGIVSEAVDLSDFVD